MAWIKARVTDDGDNRFVACYRDPEGRQRSAGTYSSRRAAERAANREEAKVREGAWHDHSRGQVTFAEYVETVWLPSKQVETSTLAAYRSYLDKHFIPTFGRRPMGKILPSEIQRWVTTATENGLSAASRAASTTPCCTRSSNAPCVDRVVTFNPCAHTELPKMVKKKARTLTPDEYDAILAALPAQHRLMVETAINTGLRWGELIALKPRHLDLDHGQAHRRGDNRRGLDQELPHRRSGCSPSPTPRTTNPAPWASHPSWSTSSPTRSPTGASSPATCCSRPATAPRSPGTPSAPASGYPPSRPPGVDFDVRVHDLRHAHASWLLAGGSDLKSVMDRMGHAQITTTQKYLHTLPDADAKNLTALDRIRSSGPGSRPDPAG